MVDEARETVSEVPANGTDSARGDYLPTVEPPAGLQESQSPAEGQSQ